MKTSFFLTLLIVPVLVLSVCGCRQGRSNTIAVLTGEGTAETDRQQREKEVFDREIERLNTLDDAPSLPDTPGGEKLVQAADRLNKWIQDRALDEFWKPNDDLLRLEKKISDTALSARQIVQGLQLLQGETVSDENGRPIVASETLEKEVREMTEHLAKIETQLKEVAVDMGISDIAAFVGQVESLRKRLESLKSIPNVGTAHIRALAKQLDKETRQFLNVSDALQRFASEMRIEGLFIHPADVDYLKQAVWLRDISNWACGDKQDALEKAKNLFDWTVCNIDLRDQRNPFDLGGGQTQLELRLQYPWQSLILGFGTVWDRAWVFVELLRQQRIDSCFVMTTLPARRTEQNGQTVDIPEMQAVWAVGVLLDDELYLFLPMYGLALPGPKGCKFTENGALEYEDIATLSQVLADDSLLRQLDQVGGEKFFLTSEQIQNSSALLAVPAESASMRMKVVESELSGEQNMILYTDSQQQRQKFMKVRGLNSVELWKYPFRAKFEQILLSRMTTDLMAPFQMLNPKRNDYPLWSGRILYFKGKIVGQDGAMLHYQQARIPDREIMAYRSQAEFRNNPIQETWLRLINGYATYWLGTASFELDSLDAAKDFFRTLEKNPRQNPWASATQYMLGRVAEQEKQYDVAARHFEQAIGGTSRNGNRLRAQWIRRLAESENK